MKEINTNNKTSTGKNNRILQFSYATKTRENNKYFQGV